MLRKLILLAALFPLLSAAEVVADVDFGVNVDWSKTEGHDQGDWGVGARLDGGGNFRGMVDFDYFFKNTERISDNDFELKFWELNGNLIYQFPSQGVHPYLGGGVGFARRTLNDLEHIFNDERTEFGLNVLGGIKFGEGAVKPFIEFRGTFYPSEDSPLDIGDRVRFGDRFVVSGGILF